MIYLMLTEITFSVFGDLISYFLLFTLRFC